MTNAAAINDATSYRALMITSFDDRMAYELVKNPEGTSIQSKLAAMKAAIDHDVITGIMFAAGVEPTRINRQERQGARYNVYAYEKDINIARTLAAVASLNHYTLHILKTAKALLDSKMTVTHDDAFCACLKGSKPKDARKTKLISRYTKTEVATGTASTQSSSSINALQSFGILVETRNEQGVVAYRLNMENEATTKLLALVA